MKYFIAKTISDQSFASVRTKTEDALKAEGFGILTEIDIQATMKKKLDKVYKPYLILGACNPTFADKVLQAEPNIGALLPCNVTIRETETGEIEVAIMDPSAAMAAVDNPAIEPLAGEVKEKLIKALESI
ncbi:DUF302 domain-containing protein [Lunatibacter salilacus]|uniref:DUF302 domain-containing protein n=1 Tax=Lunatibacter salilacus TaxID=2483804 RepID=UPI00131A7279|nr:DUF302 domain-containing protein [Lunatibacter salilacus]